ncbi:MAG: AhpC/TSA family protein [Cyanobacteria bacterium SBLK]|nr:AhpC/TSA family protein [Cyanobacteria bacterium SBLK]
MSLTQDLADLLAQNRAKQPKEAKVIMAKTDRELAESGIIDRTLKEGETVPNFTLANVKNQSVALQDLLKKGAVVLSFYRGGWCPYCNMELRGLQKVLPEIQALDATLVAVSPETPDNSLSTAEKNELTFEVLSDESNKIARELGLVFTVPEELRPVYESFGIDLPARNGDTTFELPIPATYVIAPDGTIVHAFANTDYTKRLDPEDIIAALKKITVAV